MSLKDLLVTGANLVATVIDYQELVHEGRAPIRAAEEAARKGKKRVRAIVQDLEGLAQLVQKATKKETLCACCEYGVHS